MVFIPKMLPDNDLIIDPNTCSECFCYYSDRCYSCKKKEYDIVNDFINNLELFVNGRFRNPYLTIEIIEEAGLQLHLTSYLLYTLIRVVK